MRPKQDIQAHAACQRNPRDLNNLLRMRFVLICDIAVTISCAFTKLINPSASQFGPNGPTLIKNPRGQRLWSRGLNRTAIRWFADGGRIPGGAGLYTCTKVADHPRGQPRADYLRRPEERLINLTGANEIFELFQTRKRPELKDFWSHVDPLE